MKNIIKPRLKIKCQKQWEEEHRVMVYNSKKSLSNGSLSRFIFGKQHILWNSKNTIQEDVTFGWGKKPWEYVMIFLIKDMKIRVETGISRNFDLCDIFKRPSGDLISFFCLHGWGEHMCLTGYDIVVFLVILDFCLIHYPCSRLKCRVLIDQYPLPTCFM